MRGNVSFEVAKMGLKMHYIAKRIEAGRRPNNVTYFYYGISIILLYETFPLSMTFSTVQLTLLNFPQVRAN